MESLIYENAESINSRYICGAIKVVARGGIGVSPPSISKKLKKVDLAAGH